MDISLLEETIMLYTEQRNYKNTGLQNAYGKESRALR